MKSLNCDFFSMATTIPWVKDGHSCMASTAVTQCLYSSSGGSPSSPSLPTWLHPRTLLFRAYANDCLCAPVQTPSFLTVWCNLGITHSQVTLQQIKCSGNLTWPSPTSPHCRLSAHPKSLLEFGKVETKACFWYLLGYIVTLSWVFFTSGCAKERCFWVKLPSILPTN